MSSAGIEHPPAPSRGLAISIGVFAFLFALAATAGGVLLIVTGTVLDETRGLYTDQDRAIAGAAAIFGILASLLWLTMIWLYAFTLRARGLTSILVVVGLLSVLVIIGLAIPYLPVLLAEPSISARRLATTISLIGMVVGVGRAGLVLVFAAMALGATKGLERAANALLGLAGVYMLGLPAAQYFQLLGSSFAAIYSAHAATGVLLVAASLCLAAAVLRGSTGPEGTLKGGRRAA
jgi:hypothetical protein